MKLNRGEIARQRMNSAQMLVGLFLALMLFAPSAGAQAQSADGKSADLKPSSETHQTLLLSPEIYQTLYLNNVSQVSDLTDLMTDMRNMLPRAKLFAEFSQNAISIHASAEDIQLAQKILSELDRPRKIYRLTYTMTETDGGKRVGTQHFILLAASGQKTELMQGKRVPVFVGTTDAKTSAQKPEVQFVGAQVEYVNVGLAIDATVEGNPESLSLRTKVEQSSLAEEISGVGAQDPVIRQTVLEESLNLLPGKPLTLGSIDIPGSTRKQEIEVVAELIR